MATSIHSYLTFSGNCREAMTFYQECFGGTLTFQTVGDSPMSGKLPKKMKKKARIFFSIVYFALLPVGKEEVDGSKISLKASATKN